MKFKDMKYERPDAKQYIAEMDELLTKLEQSENAETFMPIFKEINKKRLHIQTMSTLAQVRHSINTIDEFYDKENDYWDEASPEYQILDTRFVEICVKKPFREDLLKEIPETFFQLGECAMKSFDESIVPLLVEENKLASEYGKLKASCKIDFDGKEMNLAQIAAVCESKDRETRKRAYDAKMSFFEEHAEEFDTIYDKMVKVRTKIAKQLGFENFIELAYYRMNRLDYDADMIASYRKQIQDYVTPCAARIFERQRKRLGFDHLAYYDMPLQFEDGNATPVGTSDDLVQSAVKMYHEMSDETGKFIDIMVENELWDLISRPNKQMGGYMTELGEYKVPFIFSNFNGTSGDVDVLTHEAGHAFQNYMADEIEIPDVVFPTMESCEIDSMSMEFFAYPWMNLFFKDKADRYRFSHMCGTLTFLPYGALVDHFQHEVYANPDWTPKQRREAWRTLEKQYMPYKNYEGCNILEDGGWWYQQGHIFEMPFYYIDYTLAQVCAQQFFIRMNNKDEAYWNDYMHLCKLGGTLSFTNLVKEAGLTVPFEDGCIEHVVNELENWLNAVDDSKL